MARRRLRHPQRLLLAPGPGHGGGVTWAFWVKGAWGLGLALHGLAYLIDGRSLEEQKAEEILEEEERRAAQGG